MMPTRSNKGPPIQFVFAIKFSPANREENVVTRMKEVHSNVRIPVVIIVFLPKMIG